MKFLLISPLIIPIPKLEKQTEEEKMKYLFIITGVFFITACGTEKFASVSEDEAINVVASEDQPKPEEKIQALVIPEVKEKKIANKKRQKINIVGTVGKNQLKKKTPVSRTVTRIDVTNRVKVTTETKEEGVKEKEVEIQSEDNKKTDTAETVVVQKESTTVDSGPELNILFYTDKRSWGTCMDHLRKSHESFLSGISGYDWEMGFAYYADAGQAKLMPLELFNGRPHNTKGFKDGIFEALFSPESDYTLSKGEYSQDRLEKLFSNTLKPAVPDHEEHSYGSLTPNNGSQKTASPLSGLDELLSSSGRKEAPTVVLFFGHDFPYYSTEEWNDFYSRHSNVAVVAIAKRSANVSNFLHVLEKGHNFSFVANCDIQKTVDLIASQLN